jgi:EAL domain-containing protein (putative c-di-GMP-specific phosphodiesterase class I)
MSDERSLHEPAPEGPADRDTAQRGLGPEGRGDDVAIDLRSFERERLTVVFQPIVDLSDRSTIGAEAFARWEHPTYGALPAAEFLGLAVNATVRPALVERATVLAAASWSDLRARSGGVAPDLYVNIDAAPLAEPGAVERFRHVLVACDLPAEHVVIDLVTGDEPVEPAELRPALDALTDLGVRIALDDVGRMSSSLRWLRELPVTIIKIDRELLRDTDRDVRAARMLEHLVGLAVALDLDAIVEGVETDAEDAAVRAAGFRYAQGHRYGRPVPVEQFEAETTESASAMAEPEPEPMRWAAGADR